MQSTRIDPSVGTIQSEESERIAWPETTIAIDAATDPFFMSKQTQTQLRAWTDFAPCSNSGCHREEEKVRVQGLEPWTNGLKVGFGYRCISENSVFYCVSRST